MRLTSGYQTPMSKGCEPGFGHDVARRWQCEKLKIATKVVREQTTSVG
jgi:hypothetical protein